MKAVSKDDAELEVSINITNIIIDTNDIDNMSLLAFLAETYSENSRQHKQERGMSSPRVARAGTLISRPGALGSKMQPNTFGTNSKNHINQFGKYSKDHTYQSISKLKFQNQENGGDSARESKLKIIE